jgi:hypothetical protein
MVIGAFSASAAFAANHWRFDIVNKSNVAIVDFRTQEKDDWSPNWLDDLIKPGERFNMDFGTERTDCLAHTGVRLSDGSTFEADVDYCKASTLYVYDDKLTWE